MTKKMIARYEIQSELGRGGMATVYLAYDPNFRRNVAIKLVAVNFQENLLFRERFEREAHLIARIEHPAIVPVYDFGEQDNQLYLVMRYMPGGSLASKIKEGALTFRDAAQVISQIAPALDAVHTQGIIHRDLKPGNILFDSFGNPTISDFGIAHFSAATSDLTGSAIIGTPTYMSPEQVRGEELDGRSDVYALGVILFEMLAGRGPFYATTPLSIAFKHITDPIPSIRSFRPDLPIQVEFILNKALAKDREMRYARASELAQELQAIAGTIQSSETPSSSLARTPPNEGIETEVDVDEEPEPAFHVSSTLGLEEVPESNSGRSQNLSSDKAVSSGSIEGPSRSTPEIRVKRSSQGILRIVAIAALGLFLFILCGSLGVFGTWAGLSGLFSSPSPTAPPTLTAAPTENIPDIVLFSDDFSDPLSGWPTIQDAQGSYSYQADGYHISASQIDAIPWASTNRQDQDISIYVDARPVIESVNSYYGLLCRIQEDQSFYYFVIRSNGDYTIGKYKNAQFQPLFSEGWRRSDAINQGMQTNRLRADCAGNTLRFSVNNVLLGEATDTDFISGFSGMIIAALDSQGFEVIFNNFLITESGQ
jgi:serine/threonine protein kinase